MSLSFIKTVLFSLNKRLWISIIILILSGFIIFQFLYGSFGILTSYYHSEDQIVFIEPKTSTIQIAKQLQEQKIIPYFGTFLAAVLFTYPKLSIKAGEYFIPKGYNTWQIVKHFSKGKTVLHKLTIPEGMSTQQIIQMVNIAPLLSGSIKHIPEEGSLLPETYIFSWKDDRQQLIDRMRIAMDKLLKDLWNQYSIMEDCPFTTPQEALILASIVEKETGIVSERQKIAGVFLNRLKIDMPLQSDPTVIYSLTLGKNVLERPLTRQDLKYISAYNTYITKGLPPSPIACPGKFSLQAVFTPEKTDALYFVANGSGGHTFSKTLDDHNRHVIIWRKINQTKKKGS